MALTSLSEITNGARRQQKMITNSYLPNNIIFESTEFLTGKHKYKYGYDLPITKHHFNIISCILSDRIDIFVKNLYSLSKVIYSVS